MRTCVGAACTNDRAWWATADSHMGRTELGERVHVVSTPDHGDVRCSDCGGTGLVKPKTLDQLPLDSLYAGQVPHEVKSPTSRDAAQSLAPARRTTLHALVLDAICRHNLAGMTDDELQVRLGLRSQTQSPRRRELELLNLVVDSGRTRKTRLGSDAVVWVVTDAGAQVYREACGWRPHGKPQDSAAMERLSVTIASMRKAQTVARTAHHHKWHYVRTETVNLYQPAACPRCQWDWLPAVIEANDA